MIFLFNCQENDKLKNSKDDLRDQLLEHKTFFDAKVSHLNKVSLGISNVAGCRKFWNYISRLEGKGQVTPHKYKPGIFLNNMIDWINL